MEDMKMGNPLELYVIRDGYKYRLLSKVEDAAFGKVYITLIASGHRVFRFLDTDELDLIYKEGERMWLWRNVKGKVDTLDGYQVHCLESLKEAETYNRREAFRVRLGREQTITKLLPKKKAEKELLNLVESEDALTDEDFDFISVPCVIRDLSETGAGIYTNDRMELGTLVEIELTGEKHILKMIGTIVRSEIGEYGKYSRFYGCNFYRVDKNLGKYLFAVQRYQLKKERGEG
jgi:hypothetical protein